MEQRFKTFEEVQTFWDSSEGNQLSFSGLLKYLEKQIGNMPSRPIKPFLQQKHTSVEAMEYSKKLAEYEMISLPEYQTKLREFNDIRQSNNELIVELIKEESGLMKYVPLEYQSKLWGLAWDRGREDGFDRVYDELLDLIGIFE